MGEEEEEEAPQLGAVLTGRVIELGQGDGKSELRVECGIVSGGSWIGVATYPLRLDQCEDAVGRQIVCRLTGDGASEWAEFMEWADPPPEEVDLLVPPPRPDEDEVETPRRGRRRRGARPKQAHVPPPPPPAEVARPRRKRRLRCTGDEGCGCPAHAEAGGVAGDAPQDDALAVPGSPPAEEARPDASERASSAEDSDADPDLSQQALPSGVAPSERALQRLVSRRDRWKRQSDEERYERARAVADEAAEAQAASDATAAAKALRRAAAWLRSPVFSSRPTAGGGKKQFPKGVLACQSWVRRAVVRALDVLDLSDPATQKSVSCALVALRGFVAIAISRGRRLGDCRGSRDWTVIAEALGMDGAELLAVPKAEEAKGGAGATQRCPHGQLRKRCGQCNLCPHERVKRECRLCTGCRHGKVKTECKRCSGCPHGRIKRTCGECRPCPHGKAKKSCVQCVGCPHGKFKQYCSSCSGCEHGKAKASCPTCNGCPHGNLKRKCVACSPSRCPHEKMRWACKICSGVPQKRPKKGGQQLALADDAHEEPAAESVHEEPAAA